MLYLIFTEGYAATSGPSLQRAYLAVEALRLVRLLHRLLPDDAEVAGLLALMLLTGARRRARSGPDGELIPLADHPDFQLGQQSVCPKAVHHRNHAHRNGQMSDASFGGADVCV